MAGYGQFCPIAQASEVLAERWTPLVIRELLDGGRRFNEIQRGVPLMSSTLLSKRLRGLERAGIVERGKRPDGSGGEYRLTRGGEELGPVLKSMGLWSERWLRRPVNPEDADPRFLMWVIRGGVVTDELPPGRTVTHFRFPRAPDRIRYWWLVLDKPEVDLCLTDPGFGVDLTVSSSPAALASVVTGDLALGEAVKRGEVELDGDRRATSAFRRWFGLSPFAQVQRPRGRARSSSSV